MAINYANIFTAAARRSRSRFRVPNQVANSAGSYSWQLDDWTRLDRFLILGAEGGTYYIAKRELVKQNHAAIVRCIKTDGVRVVNRIVEISDAGRTPKNDPAIFVLALVVTHGDAQAKAYAFANLGKVCRIGTHLFHFVEYVNAMRGCATAWFTIRCAGHDASVSEPLASSAWVGLMLLEDEEPFRFARQISVRSAEGPVEIKLVRE
jgi:60 kDa SS-A/Ro ribonucleoprotein